jgi:hypothetical protein
MRRSYGWGVSEPRYRGIPGDTRRPTLAPELDHNGILLVFGVNGIVGQPTSTDQFERSSVRPHVTLPSRVVP